MKKNRKSRLLFQFLVPPVVGVAAFLGTIFFPVQQWAPESLLEDATWIFRGGPIALPGVTLDECWAIISNDTYLPEWVSQCTAPY